MTKKGDKKRIVLLDAHAIIHRAYHALPDFVSSKGEPTGALYGISVMLIKIIEDLKPDYIFACYDLAGPTYRHEIYKEYKAGRVKAEDELIAQIKRSHSLFEAINIPIYSKQGFEADDIIGTIVEKMKPKLNTHEVIIASGDMDTLQLVIGDDVRVYTLKKGIKDTIIYNEAAVITRYGFGPELIPDYKGLRGDPSDNIIGVKGIGEKTATILLSTFGTIENIYKEIAKGNQDKFTAAKITPRIYELLKSNQEEAEFSKMLATIRRDVPIDFVLPEKPFKETLNMTGIKQLWSELEFRTMGQKLVDVMDRLEGKTDNKTKTQTKGVETKTSLDNTTDGDLFSSGQDAATKENKESIEETGLALWLVNSTITNPQLEDIMNFSGAESFDDARRDIMRELDARNLRKVYEDIELPLMPVVKAMKERGVLIDKKMLSELGKEYHKVLDQLEKEIWKMSGVEFNVNSPKQMSEVLFEKMGLSAKNMKKTQGGAKSTRESELEKIKDLHPIVGKILEYRELQKLLSGYIDAIPPLLDDEGRLHADLISAGSTTGRMASQNPNLQNIPIRTDLGRAIRKAFIAEKGYKLVSFDYSQVELRIGAILSKDEKLVEIFRQGLDVHTSVASQVFKVPLDQVDAEMRRKAKVINFGIIYGMGVLALKQNLSSTREEAQNFYNAYFETFSGLAKYLEDVKSQAVKNGYTETFFGRRRYFEGIRSKIPYVRAQAERMAINAPIQGTEADVVKIAMVKIDEFIAKNYDRNSVRAILQVHDELVYEIKEDLVDTVTKDMTRIMESVIDPKDSSGVVLKVSHKSGDDWGGLK